MSLFIASLFSAFFIALLSMAGIITLAIREKKLKKIIVLLVSFSTGAFLGGAFFHLLPEAIEEFNAPKTIFAYTIIGLIAFFVLERILRWHHCHEEKCEVHHYLGYLNLIGDGFHNLIDGVIIASAFSVDLPLGLAVSLSIALHEIPQEISDFGVLLYSGMEKTRALIYNFLSALAVVLGTVLGWFLIEKIEGLNRFLLPFAAGGFIYVAASDLIPELHKEPKLKKAIVSFAVFLLALLFMFLIAH